VASQTRSPALSGCSSHCSPHSVPSAMTTGVPICIHVIQNVLINVLQSLRVLCQRLGRGWLSTRRWLAAAVGVRVERKVKTLHTWARIRQTTEDPRVFSLCCILLRDATHEWCKYHAVPTQRSGSAIRTCWRPQSRSASSLVLAGGSEHALQPVASWVRAGALEIR